MRLRTKLLCGFAALATFALAAQAQVPGVNSTLNSVFNIVYDASTSKPTYSAQRALYAPASGAEDVCTLYGRTTRTVRVRRIIFALRANAAGSDPVAIIKRSTAQVGGTAVTVTPGAYDSTSAASTAVAEFYTANPTTVGTVAAYLTETMVGVGTAVSHVAPTTFTFGELGSPIFLRGVAQSVSVNMAGTTLTGGAVTCTFEWTEDADF